MRIAALLMLVPGGVFTGVAVCVAVERINLWGRMSVEQYAVDYRRSLFRVDPLQPILATVTVAGAVIMAVDRPGTARALSITGGSLILLIILASIVLAEPMNSEFRKRPEGEPPPTAASIRVRWRRFHYARTAVGVTALILLVLAVSFS